MTSSAAPPGPVEVCLRRLVPVLTALRRQEADLRRQSHARVARPCCLDPLNGFSESLFGALPRNTDNGRNVSSPGTDEFWCSAVKMRHRPDLQRSFLARLGELPEFEEPRRFELAIAALAHSPEFFQWPELRIFRGEWPWRESHNLDLLGDGGAAALRRVHAVRIPHYPSLGAESVEIEGCARGSVTAFPVNFHCDEPARATLSAAARELLWLIGEWRGWCPLVLAALGSAEGKEGWRAARAVVSAARAARKSLAGNCIGIVIEGGGKIWGDSLGLGVLLSMLGDLVFARRPGIPKQWRQNIARWVSTGTLDQHILKPVAWIVPKAKAAAPRPFLLPAGNAESEPNQYPVHSVSDAVGKVTGFQLKKLVFNAAVPGLVLMALPVTSAVVITIENDLSKPAIERVETGLPALVADGIDTLRVQSSPALLNIAIRNAAKDGQTLVRVRAMQKSEGPRVHFFSGSPEKLAEEMEFPVVDGQARIGIEFAYLDAVIIEISILRKGAVRAVHVWKVEKR